MGVYPKRQKVLAGRFGFDMEKVQAGMDSGKIEAGAGLAAGLGAAVSNIGNKDLGYGVSHQGVGAATYGTGLKMAGTLGAAGAKFAGPTGALIGAGVGMAIGTTTGFFNAEDEKRKAKKLFTLNMSNAINDNAKKSRSTYAGIGDYKPQSYAKGGKISSQNKAVIMGGKLHKDGGNSVVKADNGQKIAETEREELLLTTAQTEELESIISSYESKNLNSVMVKLGKRIQEVLLHETIDNSGLYGHN